MNVTKPTELYSLNGRIVQCVNYISIKLFFKKNCEVTMLSPICRLGVNGNPSLHGSTEVGSSSSLATSQPCNLLREIVLSS